MSPTTFLTGSYDDTIRHFDLRKIKTPLSSKKLGGGV